MKDRKCVMSLQTRINYLYFAQMVVVFIYIFVEISCSSAVHQQDCNSPLGLQSGTIKDSQINATCHQYEINLGGGHIADAKPRSARLNGNGAWCCHQTRRSVHLTINLEHVMNISGIATQGIEGVLDYYVKMFSVYTSIDGTNWKAVYSDLNSTNQVWNGNTDGLGTVINMFRKQVQARHIRIFPLSYKYQMCLRLELYGCRIREERLYDFSKLMFRKTHFHRQFVRTQQQKNVTTTMNPVMTSTSESSVHSSTTTDERSSTLNDYVISSLVNKNSVVQVTQGNVSARIVEDRSESELINLVVVALMIPIGLVLIAAFLFQRFLKTGFVELKSDSYAKKLISPV